MNVGMWGTDQRVKRLPEFRKTIKWKQFPDGFPDLFIEDVKEMAGKDGIHPVFIFLVV